MIENKDKNVNHPSHYNTGKYEVIDVIDDWKLGFELGNAIKYIARAGHKYKDKTIEDLEKAIWYIQREIDNLKEVNETTDEDKCDMTKYLIENPGKVIVNPDFGKTIKDYVKDYDDIDWAKITCDSTDDYDIKYFIDK